jgi:GNAT superfamily N-acetyltransferase
MKTELQPFTKDMIPDAAVLLAEKHCRNRQLLPFLPPRFEEPEVAAAALESLLEKRTTSGYAAVREGRMVAYLLGETTVEAWGRCGWMRLPGSALAAGESIMTLQDLYVLLGDDWVKRGVFIHHSYQCTADSAVIEAWFNLDFGKERIDAVMDYRDIEIPPVQVPAGVEIRRAGPGDEGALAELSPIIMQELAKAPYWHPTPPERWADLEEGYAELVTDPEVKVWLATEKGQVLGTIGFWEEPEEADNMLVGPDTFTFSIAATHESARGRGIGTALTWTGLAHYRDEGYIYCYNNWISPNLSASRLWPRFGFKEAAYRLTRNINPMIAWTR